MSDDPGGDSPNADAKELLLEEYRSLSTTLLTNEQIGETRVNWLIGIVTAVVGGLVAMVTAEKRGVTDPTLLLIVIGFLLGLLILGLITLCRILKRNATTDGLIKDIRRIREIFRDYYDPDSVLLNYHAFGPPPSRSAKEKEKDSDDEEDRKFGGLADLVSALNSLVIAVLVGAALFPVDTIFGAAAAFGLSLWLHRKYVRKKHRETKEELRPKKPFDRAGGVVFKFEDGVPKYLFARPRKDAGGKWILPKGKIDGEEEARETALREVAEETGVFARLLRPLGIMGFSGDDGLVRTKFYLMERISEGKPIELPARLKGWFSFDEAQGDAFHPQTKKLLLIAEQRVRELQRPGK